MENNNYYPENNGYGGEAEQTVSQNPYPQYEQYTQYPQPAYITPKKNIASLAPVLMGVAAVVSSLLSVLSGVFQSLYLDYNSSAWVAAYSANSISGFFYTLFPLLVVGAFGFICYKNFSGTLKFMGCYHLAKMISGIFAKIVNAVYYAVSLTDAETFYRRYTSIVSIVSGLVSLVLLVGLSVVLIILLEKHIAKKDAAQSTVLTPPVDMYGNPMIKKDNFIIAAALTAVATALFSQIATNVANSVVAANMDYFSYDGIDYPRYSAYMMTLNIVSVFLSAANIAVLVLIPYLMTKSAEKTAKAIGCYMAGSYLAEVLTNAFSFLFYLIFGNVISPSFTSVLILVLESVSVLITAIAVFIVAKLSADKKQTPMYNSTF